MRKRICALLLILTFIFALAACKEAGQQETTGQQEAAGQSERVAGLSPSAGEPAGAGESGQAGAPDASAPAGWGDPGQDGEPSVGPAEAPEFKEKIYPEPPDEGIEFGSISVGDFLAKVNPALIAAGRDELLIDDAKIDENMDDEPPLEYFFIYFSRSGLEIDFSVNRETQKIESSFIALYVENEYADYEADFYFNLFLIMFEPNEYSRILDEIEALDGAMKTVDGENWSILRQPTLINFFPK